MKFDFGEPTARRLCPNNGKVQHESEEVAEEVLYQVLKLHPTYQGQPYFCVYCMMWHIGRKTERPRKSRRKRT